MTKKELKTIILEEITILEYDLMQKIDLKRNLEEIESLLLGKEDFLNELGGYFLQDPNIDDRIVAKFVQAHNSYMEVLSQVKEIVN